MYFDSVLNTIYLYKPTENEKQLNPEHFSAGCVVACDPSRQWMLPRSSLPAVVTDEPMPHIPHGV